MLVGEKMKSTLIFHSGGMGALGLPLEETSAFRPIRAWGEGRVNRREGRPVLRRRADRLRSPIQQPLQAGVSNRVYSH